MLPTITLRRLLVACALLIPAIASAAPLETDLGERLSTALSAITAPGGSMRLAYLLAFLGGLATSLTPCVYPLIPITISLFGAREAPRAQALGLAACYVGGIAATYTTLGLAVGLLGGQFGSFMTSPWVIVPAPTNNPLNLLGFPGLWAQFAETPDGFALTLTDEDGFTGTAQAALAHEAAQDAARRAVEQADWVRLSLVDQERFAAALLAPPKPAQALKRAFSRKRQLLQAE